MILVAVVVTLEGVTAVMRPELTVTSMHARVRCVQA